MSVPVLLTLQQFSQKHPAFPVATLYDLVFKSKSRKSSKGTVPANGLAIAIVRNGRRVLSDEAKFFEWLQQQQRAA
jgi:hypothetical protein